MRPEPIITEDGSHTLYDPLTGEHFHSIHGAITESQHVFIREGLAFLHRKEIHILEIGFGTGLNALLSWIYARNKNRRLAYTGIEKYPLGPEILSRLNHADCLGGEAAELFEKIHLAPWNREIAAGTEFRFRKQEGDILETTLPSGIHLVYFDAFSPERQPELWTPEVFGKLYECMDPGGILTTYSAKGKLKRNLQETGFRVEALPGPPGKREMTRAIKPD